MAWTPTDNFESYSTGASLNGGSGGSGWSGNWSTSGTTVENAPAGMTGKSAFITGNEVEAVRTFTEPTGTNIVTFKMRPSVNNVAIRATFVDTGVASRFLVRFDSDGNIKAGGSGSDTLQAYSANTTYTIKVKFGHNGNNFQVSIDGGAFSGDFATNGDPLTISQLNMTCEGNTSFYFDDIGPGADSVSANYLPLMGAGA